MNNCLLEPYQGQPRRNVWLLAWFGISGALFVAASCSDSLAFFLLSLVNLCVAGLCVSHIKIEDE